MTPPGGRGPRAQAIRRGLMPVMLVAAAWVAAPVACRRVESGDASAVPVPADPGGPVALRLVSFNVRYESSDDSGWRAWRERVVPMTAEIRRMDPDVIGVQEALHGQAADLRASLPDYGFHGVGRDDGGRGGEYAAIFWRKERFLPDMSDAGTFWLSGFPEQAGSRTWGNETVRACAWIRLRDRATGRGFYVFNTHFDHRHQGSRERAAELIASRIDSRRHDDEPVVLLGDFNANEDNPAIRRLTGGEWPGALRDTFVERNGRPANRRTLHFWSGSHDGPWKVDHILVSRVFQVKSARIVYPAERGGPLPSDHFAVAAEVFLPRQP